MEISILRQKRLAKNRQTNQKLANKTSTLQSQLGVLGAGALILAATAMTGCKGNSTKEYGMLVPVKSKQQLTNSIRNGLKNDNEKASVFRQGDVAFEAVPTAESDSSGGFTTTYVQEASVDEMDIVKYDGNHLYVSVGKTNHDCCFTTDLASFPNGDSLGEKGKIRILATDPTTANVELVTEVELDEHFYTKGMYLDEDQLITLGGENSFSPYGSSWFGYWDWQQQISTVMTFNKSNPDQIDQTWSGRFDGGIVESRKIGDTLYVVSRYTPYIPELQQAYYDNDQNKIDALLSRVDFETLLPTITIDQPNSPQATRPLVNFDQCFVNGDPDAGYPVITTITAFNINSPSEFNSICYNEESDGIYLTESSIYLSNSRWDEESSHTRIHKFSIDGPDLDYRGSGQVKGRVYSGGQTDFRLSEKDGFLRVFSHVSNWFFTNDATSTPNDSTDNFLTVLKESDDELALEQVSQIPNESQPKEIGKPNEALYGVRFFGDYAYAVTFQQIDPLYVIDMADPYNPKIDGELEVTGFSDFLHPVSNELLLGLGQSETGAIKLELFNISDKENPTSLSVQTIGERWSYSEARYNRHAFTYQADVNGVDRFALPASEYDQNYHWKQDGLYMYEIRNKENPGQATIETIGNLITAEYSQEQQWSNSRESRSVFHDDAVFFIQNGSVWSNLWGTNNQPNGPK